MSIESDFNRVCRQFTRIVHLKFIIQGTVPLALQLGSLNLKNVAERSAFEIWGIISIDHVVIRSIGNDIGTLALLLTGRIDLTFDAINFDIVLRSEIREKHMQIDQRDDFFHIFLCAFYIDDDIVIINTI